MFVVENTNESKQTLVIVGDDSQIVPISNLKEGFRDEAIRTRSFRVFKLNDWKAFFGVMGARPKNPLLLDQLK
ncbi:MAG: hypothetical protein MPN21_27520 [Thermoanaerobaculia bacterium]|nr:hypothetical protein [Thermoanaerobaculia bacterium]